MKKLRSSILRASLVATSGFIAGAAVESRIPFYQRLEDRVKRLVGRVEPAVIEPPATPVNPPVPIQLPYLSDQLFETTDNMLVFMFPSEELYLKQSGRVSDWTMIRGR